MEHITDIQMTALLGGHVEPGPRQEAEQHLAACEPCRSRYQQFAGVWSVLGQWEPACPDVDLRQRILARAREDTAGGISGISGIFGMRRRWASITLRAAASIVLAIGVGYVAGRWGRTTPSLSLDELRQRTASSLYLDMFESGTPAGLSELVLADSQSAGKEEQ